MSGHIRAVSRDALSFCPAERLKSFLEPTVWHKITPLAQAHGAVNLGQGFPGFSPPDFVKDALARVAHEDPSSSYNYLVNQYARSQGDMKLTNVLANQYSSRLDRTIDAATEVMVGNGATGVLFCATQALLNPGDEVVVFEPAFDIYSAQAAMAGASVKYVSLHMTSNIAAAAAGDSSTPAKKEGWTFDISTFEAALGPNTRMIILNTPHNPTGKVFTRSELLDIASAVQKWPQIVVVADEVYEHLVYEDGGEHISIASFTADQLKEHASNKKQTRDGVKTDETEAVGMTDMYNRCLTVSSSGKTLACTGWKVGWAVGPPHLLSCLSLATAWVSFSVNTPAQVAVADCLNQIEKSRHDYYPGLVADYAGRLAQLTELFSTLKIPYARPQGSFFLIIDVTDVNIPEEYLKSQPSRDWAFSVWAIEKGQVATIPCSVFYGHNGGTSFVRVAFAQSDATMSRAVSQLRSLLQPSHSD